MTIAVFVELLQGSRGVATCTQKNNNNKANSLKKRKIILKAQYSSIHLTLFVSLYNIFSKTTDFFTPESRFLEKKRVVYSRTDIFKEKTGESA